MFSTIVPGVCETKIINTICRAGQSTPHARAPVPLALRLSYDGGRCVSLNPEPRAHKCFLASAEDAVAVEKKLFSQRLIRSFAPRELPRQAFGFCYLVRRHLPL